MSYKADRVAFNKYFNTDYGDNLACRHCGLIIISEESIRHYQMMAEFREWFGRAMRVISGTRCEFWNRHEGGADKSLHLEGIADDIAYPDEFYSMKRSRKQQFIRNMKNKWDSLSKKYGVRGGFGIYDEWFHMDSRPLNIRKPDMALWDRSDYF